MALLFALLAFANPGGNGVASLPPAQAVTIGPLEIVPGEDVVIGFGEQWPPAGLRLTNPYYITASETLPGFRYSAEAKKSYLELTSGKRINVNTQEWPAGVHHLVLEKISRAGKAAAMANFAVKVRDCRLNATSATAEAKRLQVVVEPSRYFGPGTHFGRFLRLHDGTLLAGRQRSTDGGETWSGDTGGFGVGGEVLRGEAVLGLDYRALPDPAAEGWYRIDRYMAEGNDAFRRSEARLFVPAAKAAQGHALHPGPLFMRSIVERSDGSLVALMAGWFKSDTAVCPYGHGRPYSRSYTCESFDGGTTWRYLNTIAYDQLGSEGYNEGSMRRLPNGELLVVLRAGSEKDFHCQDNPIMWSVSGNEGRDWSKPQRTGLEGAYPSLAVLDDGWIVMSYGRPGAMVAFSHDNGRTWTDTTCVDATPYSGYTDVVGLGGGRLLVGFGVKDYLDRETGTRTDGLRLARLRYRSAN